MPKTVNVYASDIFSERQSKHKKKRNSKRKTDVNYNYNEFCFSQLQHPRVATFIEK